jgi:hypothetical protein
VGYVIGGEHLIQLKFKPQGGRVYEAEWVYDLQVYVNDEATDPGPKLLKTLESNRAVIMTVYSLPVRASPAWNRDALHPFVLEAATHIYNSTDLCLRGPVLSSCYLREVSIWEHGQSPRYPIVRVTEPRAYGRPHEPID